MNIRGIKLSRKMRLIITIAVCIRLLALFIISRSGEWETSFINVDINDDFKYENGALYYAEGARKPIDPAAFRWAFNKADPQDWTGNHLDQPFQYATFWYLICCFLVYVTKTKYAIRLFNILLAAIAMKYIYGFATLCCGDKTARRACILYAILPYPVLFCCFGYKEELAMLCTFYLLYHAMLYRRRSLSLKGAILHMAPVMVLMLGIRSGVSLMLVALCAFIMIVKNISLSSEVSPRKAFLMIMAIGLGIVLFIKFGDTLLYKMSFYLRSGENRGEGTAISFLMVNGVRDMWKIPITYMFSIMMPIGRIAQINSWATLVSALNIFMAPIAVGSTLYIITKKPDPIVYWGCLVYYLIYIVASLNIFRQYAALLPLSLIAFSDFIRRSSMLMKCICFIGGTGLVLALFAYSLGGL